MYFDGFLAREPGLVADFQPAQPFDPDIAFPARHHEARGIALLGTQHLAIHAIGDMQSSSALLSGIERFIAAASPPSAMIHLAFGLRPACSSSSLQRHAGVLHAMHHAVGVLAAIELGAAPFHAGIGRAFEKIDPVDARQPLEVVQREDQRLVDEAVHHQPVVARVDLRDAAMMALEAEPVRRDDAVELMQRREAHRGFRRRGQPGHGAADDILFVFRGIAVGAHTDTIAELARPAWNVRRKIFGVLRACAALRPRPQVRQRRQETAARRALCVVRLSHRRPPGRRPSGGSYHILFCECNRISTSDSLKFSRSHSAQPAPFFPPRHTAQPNPRPADLRCLR